MYIRKGNICFCKFRTSTLLSAHTNRRKTNMRNDKQHTYGNGLTELFFSFSNLKQLYILMPILLLLQRLTNVFSKVNT